MSDDDKPTRDLYFTPSGKFAKGHPGFNQHTKGKFTADSPDTQPSPDIPAGSFDDDLIAAADDYGRPRSKIGRRAWCENLRDSRPVEFAGLLSKALARKDEAQINAASGSPSVQVFFTNAPAGMFVDENGQLVEAADAKAEWERRAGMKITDEPPPFAPPTPKPTLVPSRDEEEDYDEPPYTMEEVNRMTKEEFDAAIASGEIVIIDKQR